MLQLICWLVLKPTIFRKPRINPTRKSWTITIPIPAPLCPQLPFARSLLAFASSLSLAEASTDQNKANFHWFLLLKRTMPSEESKPLEGEAPSSPSSSDSWKERIFIPTLLAGIVGGGAGLMSRHRKVHGLANISSTYATNLAIVTGCYCGAREFVRATRKTGPDDLLNSAIAGFGTGALLGRLQGGQLGAFRYSIIFAIVGTTADFATLRLSPLLRSYSESIFGNNGSLQKDGWLKLPEWSPIQVLDEEALAAKQAREQQLYAQRAALSKEES